MIRLLPLTLLALGALVLAPAAAADRAQEAALAKRYAPVVRLVSHTDCGPGKALPADRRQPALRRADGRAARAVEPGDLVKIGPTAKDLSQGLFEYHLDFPGSALEPGCDYLRWERRLVEGQTPAVYAHVATEPGARASSRCSTGSSTSSTTGTTCTRATGR